MIRKIVDGLSNHIFTRYLPTKDPVKEPLEAFMYFMPTVLAANPVYFSDLCDIGRVADVMPVYCVPASVCSLRAEVQELKKTI